MAIKVTGAKPKKKGKKKKKGLLRRIASKLTGRGRRGKAGKKAGTSGGG